jgi:hypothetical protein
MERGSLDVLPFIIAPENHLMAESRYQQTRHRNLRECGIAFGFYISEEKLSGRTVSPRVTTGKQLRRSLVSPLPLERFFSSRAAGDHEEGFAAGMFDITASPKTL